jgi:hypothetical protein
MIVQNVIRVRLVAVLVCLLIGVHRPLLVREWKRLRKRWRTKRRKPSQRGKKGKPFAGLTRQPICERCVTEAEKQERQTQKEPSKKIERERGRRPEVDTSNHFCPERSCQYYGWVGKGNIIICI